jgi:hypothetical protein
LPARSSIHFLPSGHSLFSALRIDEIHRQLLGVNSTRESRIRDAQKSGLSTTLDELVGLDDELLSEDPTGKRRVGGEGSGSRVPGDLER